MKSVIKLEIELPQTMVAELFADPENDPKWMDDLERYEPISGEPGKPGSTYRLVSQQGKMVFVATVISVSLPAEIRLRLEASNVTVLVKGTFTALSTERSRLISEEEFRFKGLFNKIFGFLAQRSIKRVHRRHMEGFKRFAEAHR